ncbi:MAG TPA: sensor domain-containing diguanylate cyclase [Acidobacteriota bacterium]|nr:sensor domain-containing diguanylate cyclase [Acidobacteriota bacterium]
MALEANPIIHSGNLLDMLRQKLPSRKRSAAVYHRLLAISELSSAMNTAGDIKSLQARLADYFQKFFPDDNIRLCIKYGDRYRKIRLSGPSVSGKFEELSLHKGLATGVIKSGDLLWFPDVRSSQNPPQGPQDPAEINVASILIIPFFTAGAAAGCIEMMSRQANRFDDMERHLGMLVAGHLSASFENMLARQELASANARLRDKDARLTRMNEQLRRLAITDEVTGLFNKRRLLEQLDMEAARSIRYGEVFSCLMIDIDDFKSVNDTHGHPAGDEVLRQIGALLRKSLRATDFIARYGGEEFMVIMPRTNSAGAFRAAENLRSKFMTHEFVVPAAVLKITISIGVASFSGNNPTDVRRLIIQADEALYRAKGHGKNQTCFADSMYSEGSESDYCQTDRRCLTHRSVAH